MQVRKRIVLAECLLPQPPVGGRPVLIRKVKTRVWSRHDAIALEHGGGVGGRRPA